MLVFACSLQTNMEGKIKAGDARTICSGPYHVDEIFYFCETDVPVGLRNKLKKHCKEKLKVDLTIFDGTALAENLVSPDVFWIAQQYIGIPAKMYPSRGGPDENYGARGRGGFRSIERRFVLCGFHGSKDGPAPSNFLLSEET